MQKVRHGCVSCVTCVSCVVCVSCVTSGLGVSVCPGLDGGPCWATRVGKDATARIGKDAMETTEMTEMIVVVAVDGKRSALVRERGRWKVRLQILFLRRICI